MQKLKMVGAKLVWFATFLASLGATTIRDILGESVLSVLHSHWSRNVEARLSLVERCCYASSLMP